MTLWQRIAREPTSLLGLVTATTGLLILFGVPLTLEQAGGILGFVGAVLVFLRFVLTPAREVVVQQLPGESGPVAGHASEVETGQPVVVDVTPIPTLDELLPPDDAGRVELAVVVGAVVVLALVVLVGLVLFRVV